MDTLPLEDMKTLFDYKLENHKEVKELFDIIKSDEFIDILKRMSSNEKFNEIKNNFENYGFDFKYLCTLSYAIVGEYLNFSCT